MKKMMPLIPLLLASHVALATGVHNPSPVPVPSPGGNTGGQGGGSNFPGSSGGFGGGVGAVPPIAPNPSPVPSPVVPLPRPIPGVVNNGGQGGAGGVGGQGGSVAPGAVANNVNVTGGGVNVRYPVQAPGMAIGTGMSYSQANCANGVGAAGSGQGGGGSFLWPWESDACNARLDSAHFAGLGLHKSACFRFIQMDDNADAMKSAGESCENVNRTAVAVPMPGAIVPTATPTLDRVMPMDDYVPREELNRKLDNAHRLGVVK